MTKNNLLVILGNQLFPIEKINKIGCKTIFMKEDLGFNHGLPSPQVKDSNVLYSNARV